VTSIGRFLGAVLIALLTAIGPAAADALKDDAIARLAASHEPDLGHIDTVCAEAVLAVSQAAAQADPFMDTYRRRTAN